MQYYDRTYFTKFSHKKPYHKDKSEYVKSIAVSVQEILQTTIRLDHALYEKYNNSTAFNYGVMEGMINKDQNYIYEIHMHLRNTILKFEPRIIDIELNRIDRSSAPSKIVFFFTIKTEFGNFSIDITINMI